MPTHPDTKQKRNCKRKQSFVSMESALAKALYYEGTAGLKLAPYKCPLCSRWHNSTVKQ